MRWMPVAYVNIPSDDGRILTDAVVVEGLRVPCPPLPGRTVELRLNGDAVEAFVPDDAVPMSLGCFERPPRPGESAFTLTMTHGDATTRTVRIVPTTVGPGRHVWSNLP